MVLIISIATFGQSKTKPSHLSQTRNFGNIGFVVPDFWYPICTPNVSSVEKMDKTTDRSVFAPTALSSVSYFEFFLLSVIFTTRI